MNNLKQNAQTAVKWSAILTFGNQCVSFLISVILARLLTPSDYGLVGTISIFIEISGIFVTGGLSMALIRKIDRTQTDLGSCTRHIAPRQHGIQKTNYFLHSHLYYLRDYRHFSSVYGLRSMGSRATGFFIFRINNCCTLVFCTLETEFGVFMEILSFDIWIRM